MREALAVRGGGFSLNSPMWTDITRVTAPTSDLITLAEAKAQLRVFHSDDDALISRLMAAATATIEGPNGIGIVLLSQTWRATFNGFSNGCLMLGLGPVREITSVTYTDADGDTQTVSDEALDYDLDAMPVRIRPTAHWPSTALKQGAAKVTFEAGFGDDPEDVPADLIHAILMLIAQWYENREASSAHTLRDVPMGVESILARYRVSAIA